LFINSKQSKMRFVQFKHKNEDESSRHLGVTNEAGDQIKEIGGIDCYPSDLKKFIELGLSVDEVKSKVENLKSINTADVDLLPPIIEPQKILCVGLNYKGHCDEQHKEYPKEPMFFSKYASTLVGPTGNVIAHKISNEIDWEVELAVIIGRKASLVKKANAFDYVFGYTAAQDISARDWQKQRNGGQFLIGKSMDSFCPLGPAVVHKSALDPSDLTIKCSVNNVLKQCGKTSELIFTIEDIIERVTQSITLMPGDVILTGTPAGVGMHRSPPEFLKVGDVIESEIEGIGKLFNTVVAGK
jgi:2-keto-4-pentenoate hydratase/2-oxohepta-3-ene-1,7-dioic acid hydratase in catechol pathway